MAVADEAQSSSPVSSPQSIPDTIAVLQAQPQRPRFLAPGDVVNNYPLPQGVKDVASNAKPSTTPHDPPAAPAAPPAKRQRQVKKKDPENKSEEKPKEKKTRKPREPKDPNKPPISRKKQKTSDVAQESTASRQPTINEMVNQFQVPSTSVTQHLHPAQILREDLSSNATPPVTRPASSGQRYDPIRAAMTMDPYPPYTGASVPAPQASPSVHRASASPAISSLMNPTSSAHPAPSPSLLQLMQAPPPKHPSVPTVASPPIPKASPAPVKAVAPALSPMDFTPLCDGPKKLEAAASKMSEAKEKENQREKSTKSAPTAPKPKRTTPPPSRPKGSGLLSNSDLFGGPSVDEDDRTRHGVDINIRIPLNPAGNNTINIAQEIMKKYGRDAINPRAAAHRERLLQVANMATKLDGGSADDMSVDLNSDMENDSNVEMGGMDDEKKDDTGAEGEKPKRTRKKKVEEYDKDDDFIDDTELAWQEGAAVAKDGFFVYSGPLIPVGEEAKIERYVLISRQVAQVS